MSREPEVLLGFEVGTGQPVSIPIRHMAVVGQTQQSGKTTTLEALVARSGLRAIAFITKRGERSFDDGHRLQPYFRDRADWQFVDKLLEAMLGESNRFLRSWIIKTCRATKTLADVHAAVKTSLATAKGISEGVYTQLDAYLELIVPDIARAELAPSIDLQPGLNVMDVSGFSTPMQMLFVQSAIDWVNEHEEGVIVVVPEAWEFIPNGKGSPVKASAITLARKGAGLRNFIWADSQDLAGLDTEVRRACTVLLLGVQREANELKRTLENIPRAVARPTAADIALLELGQFYACFQRTCIRVYVQTARMNPEEARAVAEGRMPVLPEPKRPKRSPQEDPAMCQQHARLAQQLAERDAEVARLEESLQAKNRLTEKRVLGAKLLVEALGHLGLAAPETTVTMTGLDKDALLRELRESILTVPSATLEVTAPEKLRKEFQRAEVERILGAIAALKPLSKQALKLLEAVEGATLTQPTIAARLGRSYSGSTGKGVIRGTVEELQGLGVVEGIKGAGARSRLRACIAEHLEAYQPTEAEIDGVHQTVLHALATEDVAAA